MSIRSTLLAVIAAGPLLVTGGELETQRVHAADVTCAVPRDSGGNCNLTRVTIGSGTIRELKLQGSSGFRQGAVLARGIGKDAGGYEAHDGLMARVVIQPGGFSRWHYHPGVDLLMVTSGTITYYTLEANGTCKKHVVSSGDGFAELPGQRHTVLNEGAETAEVLVLFLKGEDDPAFTEPADQPPHASCPTGFNP